MAEKSIRPDITIKAERRQRSSVTIAFHSGRKVNKTGYHAKIVAHHRVLDLGEFESHDEAITAFNSAIDLLPAEWDESDKLRISKPVSAQRVLEIATRVRRSIQDHGDTDPGLTVFDFAPFLVARYPA